MVSCRKNLLYLIVILHVCLTWVSAQGDLNVTSSAELANSSLPDEEPPTSMNVQNDQESQKPVDTQPPTPAAAATEAAAEETTVKPTRQPNLVPTTPPPVVRMDPTSTVEQEKKDGSTKSTAPGLPKSDPTKKAEGGHAGISVANLALVVFSVSALLIY